MPSREGIDYVVCRLCRREFLAVTGSHLMRKHGWDSARPVLEYKAEHGLKRAECRDTSRLRKSLAIERFKRQGRHWTRGRVLREIRSLARRGAPLNHGAVGRGSLAGAAARFFGSWDRALAACGIDPRRTRLTRAWTDEDVLADIRRRRRAGEALNHGAVATKHPGLRTAAKNRFGSWSAALRRAGIDPASVCMARNWTRAAVLEHIREMSRRMPLHKIRATDQGLYAAAAGRFGGWVAAVRAAGFEYPPRRETWRWTRDGILRAIRAMEKSGESLRTGDAQLRRHGLYAAARREYGSWRAALAKAGCTYPKPERPGPGYGVPWKWTRDAIIGFIRKRVEAGRSIRGADLRADHGGMLAAACREFGSWRDTVAAAGCLAHLPEKRHWSKDELLGLLRDVARRDGAATQRAIYAVQRRGYVRPFASIERLFGTFSRARKAAGLAPKVRPWTRERVIDGLRRLGRPMRRKDALRHDRALAFATRKYFSTWEEALRAAGFQLSIDGPTAPLNCGSLCTTDCG